jgi:hypothetical protein
MSVKVVSALGLCSAEQYYLLYFRYSLIYPCTYRVCSAPPLTSPSLTHNTTLHTTTLRTQAVGRGLPGLLPHGRGARALDGGPAAEGHQRRLRGLHHDRHYRVRAALVLAGVGACLSRCDVYLLVVAALLVQYAVSGRQAYCTLLDLVAPVILCAFPVHLWSLHAWPSPTNLHMPTAPWWSSFCSFFLISTPHL